MFHQIFHVISVDMSKESAKIAMHSRLHNCDYYLRTGKLCRLSPSTPRTLLLTELGLLPLQVFWWRQTLQFWNSLAVLPAGSLYHTVCLDNLAGGAL